MGAARCPVEGAGPSAPTPTDSGALGSEQLTHRHRPPSCWPVKIKRLEQQPHSPHRSAVGFGTAEQNRRGCPSTGNRFLP